MKKFNSSTAAVRHLSRREETPDNALASAISPALLSALADGGKPRLESQKSDVFAPPPYFADNGKSPSDAT